MTTERERIDRMLAEGKVSAEEAERLRAALEKSEREETDSSAGPQERITRPRLSRLALAGALGMPAAVVVFLVLTGLGLVLGVRDENAAAGGLLVAVAVVLTGIGLSVAGLVAVRRAPGELTGRRAARFGIIAPLVTGAVVFLVTAVIVIVADHYRQRARLAEHRAMRDEALRRRDEAELAHLWKQFHSIVIERRTKGMPAELFQEILGKLLEPDWADAIAQGAWRDGGFGTLLGDKMESLLTARGGKAIRWSRCALEQSGEGLLRENVSGTVVVTDGRKDYHVRVVKIGRNWRLAQDAVIVVPAGGAVRRLKVTTSSARGRRGKP